MAVAELHFFDKDDPNGSTIFECSTDDQWVKQIKLDIQRDSLGTGHVDFARKVPAGGLFTRDIVVPEALVRILVPEIDATHYLWGFFINPRQQQVVSRDEQGGEGFTFAGPGPKHYLERMVLWSSSFSGFDNAVEQENGIWTWPSTARAGVILDRLLQEEQDNPHRRYLLDLTQSFGSVNDSAGVPWADDIAGNEDFTLNIGDDYLKILWQIEDASQITTRINLGTVSNPLLQLDAYQTFGRDLTGPIGAGNVHFTEGVNIATDLDVEGSSYAKASDALVGGNDAVYHFATNPGYTAGDLRKVVFIKYQSANTSTLDRAGERYLRRQDNGEKQIDLRIVPGFDDTTGLYMPSPASFGDGYFWVGDTVSLTTGIPPNQTELDYDDEPQAVTGIQMELEQAVRDDDALSAARSWLLEVQLNHERKSSGTSRDLAGSRGSVQPNPAQIRLCRDTIPPGADTPGSTVLSLNWTWETNNLDTGTSTYTLMATRQNNPGAAPVSGWWGWNTGLSTNPLISPRVPITAGQVLTVTGDFSKQLGLTLQTSKIDVAWWTGSVGGTAIQNDVIGIAASGSGRGVIASVDESIVAPALATYVTIAPYRNLYANNVTLTVTGTATPADDGRPGAGLEELVGDGVNAAHCDHTHHVFREDPPSVNDDDSHGYPVGTSWIVVDDADNPTVIYERWRLLDNTDGAALWVLDLDGDAYDIPYESDELEALSVGDAIDELIVAVDDAVTAAAGIGEILISDTPSTPLVFADLIQNEAQDDLVYADPT